MINTPREAFVVGITCFAKEAGLDRDDTSELVRLLLMTPTAALPILKAASDINLARTNVKAGIQLRNLASCNARLTKAAAQNFLSAALSGGLSAMGFPGAATALQAAAARPTGISAGATTGGNGLASWLGMEQAPTSASDVGGETDEQIWQRMWEKTIGPGRSIGATPPPVSSSMARAAIKAERRRVQFMTPQQMKEEAWQQAAGKYFNPRELEQFIDLKKRIGQASIRARSLQGALRGLPGGQSFYGADPTQATNPLVQAVSGELKGLYQELGGGRRAGWAHFGQGGLSAGPSGIKTTQEPIGGAGGTSSPAGSGSPSTVPTPALKPYTGLTPTPTPAPKPPGKVTQG